MKKFILIAMLILLPTQVQAGFLTGNKLVEYMHEDEKTEIQNPSYYKSGRYTGFIVGTFDTLSGLQMICATTDVTEGQADAIVTKYLKFNPEKWNEAAIDLVFIALRNAFPCKK